MRRLLGQTPVDPATGAASGIDHTHQEIHEGNHFYIQGFLELGNEATHYVKMVTPNTLVWSHFVFSIRSTGICATTLVEAPTGGMANGSPVVPINNNRNSGKASAMVLTGGVTVSTGGTIIENDKWGAAGFKESVGGGGGREDELILKQNTIYCRGFVSGAASNIIQFKASWYEHEDKNA